MTGLVADRGQLAAFVDLLFCHAPKGSWVSLRAFRDDVDGTWQATHWPRVQINGAGLEPLIDAAERWATTCAQAAEPVVMAPPVVALRRATGAKESDVLAGLVLSLDADRHPAEARRIAVDLLGEPTVTVESGGLWADPETGELQPKAHLHWRLAKPATTAEDLATLKAARADLVAITGTDASCKPTVHPLRWPGSWHRKAEAKLCRIVASRDREIDLHEAAAKLAASRPAVAQPRPEAPRAEPGNLSDMIDVQLHHFRRVVELAEDIPNPDLDWAEWNRLGMAFWAASSGSEIGYEAFDLFSQKSAKYDAKATRARWDHYRTSPPSNLSVGTLVYAAGHTRGGGTEGEPPQKEEPKSDDDPQPEEEPRGERQAGPDPQPKAEAPPKPEAQWPAPMAEEAYHGIVGEIVRTIEPQTEADPHAVLVQLLAAAGCMIGNKPHLMVEATRHHAKLNALIIGDTSKGRKGTSFDRCLQPLEALDPHWRSSKIVSGLSSGEGLIWCVRDPIFSKVKDKKTGEVEDVMVDPGIDDKRLLVVESEFASVLRNTARAGNTLSATLRDAWDKTDLRSLTKNSPAQATGAHIAIVAHITADELRRELDRTEVANGLANRFLMVGARRSKRLPFGGEPIDWREITDRLRPAVQTARFDIGQVHWTLGAKDDWCAVYGELSDGKAGLLGAVTGRAEAQVLRLALTYALLDGLAFIDREHIRAGLAVWEYCEATAQFVFGESLGDPVADGIMQALKAAGPSGMSRTDISAAFGRHVSASQISNALSILAATGRVERQVIQTGGRPSEVWRVKR